MISFMKAVSFIFQVLVLYERIYTMFTPLVYKGLLLLYRNCCLLRSTNIFWWRSGAAQLRNTKNQCHEQRER